MACYIHPVKGPRQLFCHTCFNPGLNDLWIQSKTLKRPGANESTAIECQVECIQLPGCEFARVQGNECQLGTLTKWEYLPETPLELQGSNEQVFVTQGKAWGELIVLLRCLTRTAGFLHLQFCTDVYLCSNVYTYAVYLPQERIYQHLCECARLIGRPCHTPPTPPSLRPQRATSSAGTPVKMTPHAMRLPSR